jgi:maleamate amidohydrolase
MAEPVWNKFLTERDKQVFGDAGYGQRGGFGKRPVILVIDVNYNFTGDRPEPILDSIKRWPNSCGEDAWESMRHIKRLLDSGRKKGLPVIYTTGSMRPDGWDRAAWSWKNKRTAEWRSNTHGTNLNGNDINPEIAPEPSDIMIEKLKPSGFHGTPLNSFLTNFKADSILMVGTTTSGCVRASVLDAFSENYRVTLVEEGCFDRSESSHAINLCDMNAKYADVVKTDEVIEYIDGLEDDMFDLPTGIPS